MTTKTALNKRLQESGEREEIKRYIRERLTQSGWRDDLKEYTIDYIKNKGLEKINVNEIVSEIAPKGRSMVPENLKTEIIEKIRSFNETNQRPGTQELPRF